MSSFVNNTGLTMMLKAMGVDPLVIAQKGIELEAQGKEIAADIKARVSKIEADMTALAEKQQIILDVLLSQNARQSRLESSLAGVEPAGETFDVSLSNTKESKTNG